MPAFEVRRFIGSRRGNELVRTLAAETWPIALLIVHVGSGLRSRLRKRLRQAKIEPLDLD